MELSKTIERYFWSSTNSASYSTCTRDHNKKVVFKSCIFLPRVTVQCYTSFCCCSQWEMPDSNPEAVLFDQQAWYGDKPRHICFLYCCFCNTLISHNEKQNIFSGMILGLLPFTFAFLKWPSSASFRSFSNKQHKFYNKLVWKMFIEYPVPHNFHIMSLLL